MVSQALTQELRLAQSSLVDLAAADLQDAWSRFDLTKPKQVRDAMLQVTPAISNLYGAAGASVAAQWYNDARLTEGVPGNFRARLAAPTPAAWVESSVSFSAQHLWTVAPSQMLLYMLGALAKHVQQPVRETIKDSVVADPAAAGWQRVTRPGACKFCRFLADRGAVYKRHTVDFAAHGGCHCAAVPSWDKDAPEVDVRVYEASQRTSKMKPKQLEYHRANLRDWLAVFD